MSECADQHSDRCEIYECKDGWRWRSAAKNGNIVDASTRSCNERFDCLANVERNGMTCAPKD